MTRFGGREVAGRAARTQGASRGGQEGARDRRLSGCARRRERQECIGWSSVRNTLRDILSGPDSRWKGSASFIKFPGRPGAYSIALSAASR